MFEVNLLPGFENNHNKKRFFYKRFLLCILGCCFLFAVTEFFINRSASTVMVDKAETFHQKTLPTLLWKGCIKSQNSFLGIIQKNDEIVVVKKNSIFGDNWRVIRLSPKGAWVVREGHKEFIGEIV